MNKSTYIQRRAELKKRLGSGLLLFLGNNEVGMNYADNGYHFRQDSSFLYYFGGDYAGLAAIIDIDEDKEIIFGNELTIDDIVWMGYQPTIREKSEKVGISETMPLSALSTYIKNAQTKGQQIHFLPPYRGDHKVWLQELLGINPAEQEEKASIPLILAIADMRNHKSEEEIECIERAVDMSVDMHLAAYKAARPGVTEAYVAAAVEHAVHSQGYSRSFPIIATTHGQTLHQHKFMNTLHEGEIFLLDAGAEDDLHYAGDLSSSMPVGDRFTEQQEIIYNLHLRSFQAAVDALAPGVPFRNAHMAAAITICEGMKELGLMKGDPKDAAYSGAYAMFFPCGVGHMMGLDVHDMENLGEKYVGYDNEPKSKQFGFKSLRLARKLEPGFVFTIEPGIYFIPELIDKWKAEKQFTDFICYDKLEAWKNFSGLRNELDYLITPDGARVLGHKKKPMTLEEVYAARE
ncbi:MAG: aminopeptidase P N-terminal domain-containing protein [Prevotellaceae bacterium]|nr:aminopeptidase P N-terminal domain-containing protein [Candidatus Minthosoma equi]